MNRFVDEGVAFQIHGEDRAQLSRVLGRSLEWREDGVAVWGIVGHVRLPSKATLVIRSAKAPAACVLAWAAYVDPTLSELRNLRLLPEVASDGDVGGALARVFCAELLAVAGAHGLRKRYRRVVTRSSTVRGPIDFSALVRSGGDLTRTPCSVWLRLPRTPLNQLFVAALDRIHRDPILRATAGTALVEARSLLADVVPAVDPDLLAGRRPLERDELAFGTVCALARLILRGAGLATGADSNGIGFLVHIDALFERAVVRAFEDADVNGVAKHPAPYQRLDDDRLVAGGRLELDYFVRGPDGSGIVVDAKYKRKVDPANLQQMVTYCHITGATRAILVFPKGQVHDCRPYVLRAPNGASVRIDIVELDSSGRSLCEWHASGQALSERVSSIASSA